MGVTIGLPFLNCERTLERALRSIFAQTYEDWELILVDDGSSDRSLAIARAVRDPRVRVVSDGKNRGLVERLNQIAQLARHPYVCRMDGDDLAHPERLAAQVAHLEGHRDVDVLGTLAIAIDAEDRPSRLRGGAAERIADPATVLRHGGLIHPSVMARIEWLRRFPYDPAYPRAEDLELWVRASGRSTLAQLPRVLYYYRESGTVNLANYRRTCATERKVLLRYGPGLVGRARTVALVGRSFLKEATYWAFTAAGQSARLIERRGVPLTPEQLREAGAAIATILGTAIPGVERARA